MMKTYMGRVIGITSLAAIAIVAPARANAQSVETTANVPFAFVAGDTSLPRGEYRMATLPGHTDALMIRGLQHGAIILSQPAGSSRADNTPRLVFDRFGDQYFLREIHLAGNVSFTLPLTTSERGAAAPLARGEKSEVVVVRTAQ
jgi:hypothetical protein